MLSRVCPLLFVTHTSARSSISLQSFEKEKQKKAIQSTYANECIQNRLIEISISPIV